MGLYCIFDPSLVVIKLQLFKGDSNNENLTKLEHTYTKPNLMETYIQSESEKKSLTFWVISYEKKLLYLKK